MMWVALILLQVSAPVEEPSEAQPISVAAEAEEPTEAEPAEPKMKKICRKVMDPRVGTLSARRTVCKYVQVDDDSGDR